MINIIQVTPPPAPLLLDIVIHHLALPARTLLRAILILLLTLLLYIVSHHLALLPGPQCQVWRMDP